MIELGCIPETGGGPDSGRRLQCARRGLVAWCQRVPGATGHEGTFLECQFHSVIMWKKLSRVLSKYQNMLLIRKRLFMECSVRLN